MRIRLALLGLAVFGRCFAQSDDDGRKVLALICPKGEYDSASGTCNACPAGTATDTEKLKPVIESTISGHLLGPGSDDLLVAFKGCEASFERRDITFSVLFTKGATGWTVDPEPADGWFGDSRCITIPNRAGRDGLFCSDEEHHDNGNLTREVVYFSYVDRRRGGLLLAAFSVDPSFVSDDNKLPYPEAHIKDKDLVPESGGKFSLHITATCRKVRKVERRGEAKVIPVTPMREYRMDYQFDGEMFRLAPGSQVVRRAYDACARSQWDDEYKY
jgi:hypothetical protein